MWNDILGNEIHKKFLERYLHSDGRPHALLFTGPDGLGKRRLAYAFAQSLLCPNLQENDQCPGCRQFVAMTHPDFIEIKLLDDKKTILIDQVRELIAGGNYAPVMGKNKVVIVNDADLLQREGANAILKILEEPPLSWTIILLAAKEERLLPTILSRVVTLRFKPLGRKDVINSFLQQVHDEEHAGLYADLAEGSIGTAIELFERDALTLRDECLRLLEGLPSVMPLNLAGAVCKELDNTRGLERKEFLLWLKLLEMLLRDCLMLKYGVAQLHNKDVEFTLRKISCSAGVYGLQRVLELMENAYRECNSNVGVRQIIEELILQMNNCFGR